MFNLSARGQSHIADLDEWFGRQRFDQIICIGGNHDFALEAALADQKQPFKNAHYLQDMSFHYDGLHIYGSPWVPDLPNHAFSRGETGRATAWANIPTSTDILITHVPPFGILDRSSRGQSYGCPILFQELERIAPKVHCFGHVHASAGAITTDETLFINASSIESRTKRMVTPITFQFDPDKINHV